MDNTKKTDPILIAYLSGFEKISLVLLRIGFIACMLSICAAFAIRRFGMLWFPDDATVCYWSIELFLTAKELLGVFFVPVLFFELLLILLGKKTS